jgi:type IV pilus biogenesis protein CpaD/CtpE
MFNVRSVLVLAALLIPSAASGESSMGVTPCGETRDCERDPLCMAKAYAELLSAPRAPREMRLDAAVVFERMDARVYSADREKLMRFAAKWQQSAEWSVITVEGYAKNDALAQKRAEKIRGYLVKYGIDPEFIVAVGRTSGQPKGHVDLTIGLCDREAGECPNGQLASK